MTREICERFEKTFNFIIRWVPGVSSTEPSRGRRERQKPEFDIVFGDNMVKGIP